MAAAFNDEGYKNEYIASLQKALKGNKANYHFKHHTLNTKGNATAQLIGGNLCMMVHSLATKSCYNTKNKILFIEDIGEYIYSIDRMLIQLKRASYFKDLAGLVVGGFTDIKDTTIPFGKNVYDIIDEHFKEYNFPIAYNFPVGHQTENLALKIGATFTLNVSSNKCSLAENISLK
jgi:muramoyltetrapeptide carboxypeptidase